MTLKRTFRGGGRTRLAAGPAAFATMVLALLGSAPLPAQQSPARLTARLDPQSGDLVLSLGPIDLPAGATHHQVLQPMAQEVPVPGAGWLRGYRVELVDRSGRPVPQSVLHHLNLITPGRREMFSPIMLRLGAAGHETAPVKLPFLMGFKMKEGEKILVTTMFANEGSRQAYQGVTLRVHMPFTPAGTWLPPFSVYPFYIDVMPPAGIHAYNLPAGKSQRSWDAHPAAEARILGVGGHLHKYGTLLRFEDVTAHKVIWEARPTLGPDSDVVGMPIGRFWWRGGVKVEPAHVYRVTAFYDNPTGRAIPEGAMGTFGGILVPSRGAVWPPLNTGDPEYRKDVLVTWSRMRMTGAGMDMPMPGTYTRAAPAPAPSGKAAPPPAGTSATRRR